MNIKQKISFSVVVLILIGIYFLNRYTDNLIINTITLVPKWIAFIFALVVMMFPRDYEQFASLII